MGKISRRHILQDFRTRSLLESTRRLIASEGFDAVTMERVAHEAGITKGGIYLYFRNKDEMILAAVEEIASEMVRRIEQQTNPTAEPWDQLCQLVRAQMEIMEQNRGLLRALLLDRRLMKAGPRGQPTRRLLRYRHKHEAEIRRALERGVRRKVFCPMNTARAAFYVNELTISTVQQRLFGLTRSSLKKATEELIEFMALLLQDKRCTTGTKE